MTVEYHADVDPGELDRVDPLARFRGDFLPSPDGTLYLDGNSLGRPPRAVRDAVTRLIERQWAGDLVRGWDDWVDLPARVGDRLGAAVLGARPGETLVSDSTSVNLYKLAAAALEAAGPGRRVLVTDDDNFPTDRYILRGIAEQYGARLRLVRTDIDTGLDTESLRAALDDETAVVCLSHVAYRSGALADMASITRLVHDAGAFMLWDLCHSAGVVPVDLTGTGADLAVGCTYKYLNAGPGAPAFLYVRGELRQRLRQPLWGWFSQRDQFEMGAEYAPRPDIGRFAVGTPPIIGVTAVAAALEVTAAAGIDEIRRKSIGLTSYAVALYDEWLAARGFTLASPRHASERGGHITVAHPHGWQISQAMRARDIVPDYRAPDRVRLGFAPLYNGFTEVREALRAMAEIVDSGEYERWDATPSAVT